MFFLFVFIVIIILVIAIHTSKIGVEIVNLRIDTQNIKKINEESKIYVYLIIFNKLKLLKKNVKDLSFKIKNKELDIKILKNKNIELDYKELFQKVKINIKKIDMTVELGTENAAFTAILVGIISSVLGIVIRKPKYEIMPIYENKNLFKLRLNGIFTIYLMHYIYNQIFRKKRRVDKNERTSNRKSYDNCYGQY